MNRRVMTGTVAVLATFSIAAAAVAADSGVAGAILKMKSGLCKFTLVQSDGVRPAAKAELTLTDAQNAERIITAKSDSLGVCSAELSEARYILAVDGRNLGLVETSASGEIADYRIILPAAAAMVAGQDPDPTTTGGGGGGGGLVLAGLGGAAGGIAVFIIGDNQNWWDGDGDDEADNQQPPANGGGQPTVVTTTVYVKQKPSSP